MQRIAILAVALVLVILALSSSANAQPTSPDKDRYTTASLTAPQLRTPPNGALLTNLSSITLSWDLPSGGTQYQLQVSPFNGDGPGINLIRNAEGQFTIPAPPTWYVLLPGMTYTWRVRVTDSPVSIGKGDLSWGPWSSSWRFSTPRPSADSITPSEPQLGATATSLNPTLVWADGSTGVFYYKVQLSEDPLFNTDPFSATKAVYWNLVHGGQTQPVDSWVVPPSARLQTGTRYYWRVRPRVQGNGTPVNWGVSFWFLTPCQPGTAGCTLLPTDLAVTDLQLGGTTVPAGGQVSIQYTVKNQGAGDAKATDVHAVLSPDVTITRLGRDLGPLGTIGALGSQQSVTQLATVTVPSDVKEGSYFLGSSSAIFRGSRG